MIATITLNPSIDRTLELDRLVVGGLNRVKSKIDHPSGKGINVSRALKLWGQPTEALALV
ncbi:MAG: 1-phosphofructokinase, partial [Firmicutes bacterium]|nr:1-phosphofructokinase [Bacillota bacterium]